MSGQRPPRAGLSSRSEPGPGRSGETQALAERASPKGSLKPALNRRPGGKGRGAPSQRSPEGSVGERGGMGLGRGTAQLGR